MRLFIGLLVFTAGFAIGRWAVPSSKPVSDSLRKQTFEDVWKYEPKTIWLNGAPKDERTLEEKVTALQAEVRAIRRHVIAVEQDKK